MDIIGLSDQDAQDMRVRTEQPEDDTWERTVRTGQPEQASQDKQKIYRIV